MAGFSDGFDAQQRAHARMQSYTGKAVATLVLYIFLWVPGLIANVVFYNEAKRMEKLAGQRLPGAGCLAALLWTFVGGAALLVLLVVLLLGSSH